MKIKWGMIGCGDVTEVKSGPAFSKTEDSVLIAVMSRTESRVKDYAQRHSIPFWYTDAEKLLDNPEVNAVYIATPPDSHAYYTALAAGKGKPVYVEKPMALNFSQCVEMLESCKNNNVPLFAAYYRRSMPKFRKVKELIDKKSIGEIRTVNVQLLQPPRKEDLIGSDLPWRVLPEISGGGYFIDMGSHQLDLLDYFLGPIKFASGLTANLSGLYPAEDTVTAEFVFENGIIGSGNWCFTANKFDEKDITVITGTEGSISYSTFGSDPVVLITGNGIENFELPWPQHVHQHLIADVVLELLGKGKSPSTGESGARTNRVMDMIYASAAKNGI